MVIRAGGKDPGLFDLHRFNQFEILNYRSDPAGYFGEIKTEFPAFFHGFTVFISIKKKFCLPDQSPGTPEPAHQFKNPDDLFDGIGRSGLLAVPERRIGDPDLFRHVHRNDIAGKLDGGNFFIGEDIPEKFGFLNII